MAETESKDRTGRLFVVTGPSGSGKSTLCREVIRLTDARLSVSATTRPPGKKETHGKDYYFLDEKEFKEKIETDEFLEYAHVFGHYYGTPAEPVRDKLRVGQTVVLEIDVQGALQVFERFPQAIGILVLPPNQDILRQRLSLRARDDSETIEKRLAKAQWEIEKAQKSENFKHTIINDELDKAIEAIVELVG